MISLQPINESNFLQAFALEVSEDQQKFVSDPIRSLAQAYVYRDQCQPFGIYNDDTMVGYVMVVYDYDIPEYDRWTETARTEAMGSRHYSVYWTIFHQSHSVHPVKSH